MVSIGLDAVEIDRFKNWHTYSKSKLMRVFSSDEINYCLSEKNKSAERFAVRFAAKEALLKALTPLLRNPISFLTLCKASTMIKKNNIPYLIVTWKKFDFISNTPSNILVSLTHTKTTAIAVVFLLN